MAERQCSRDSSPGGQPQDQRAQQDSCQVNNNHELEDYEEDTPPYFGHAPGDVPDGWFRVASINLDNLPRSANEPKKEELFKAVCNFQIDVLPMQETGVNWQLVSYKDSFQQRLNEFFEPGQTCS